MKKVIFSLLFVFFLCGCSSNSIEEPLTESYIPISVFSTKGEWEIGEEMKLYIYPPLSGALPGHYKYIDKVEYFIDGIKIDESTQSPFDISYKIPESMSVGKHKIKPKLTLNTTNIIWETNEWLFYVREPIDKEPEKEKISKITIRIDGSKDEEFIRKNILIGNKAQIEVIIHPENESAQEVIFDSSDNLVATVEFANNAYNIITHKIGFSEIVAKVAESNHKATCELNVRNIDFYTSVQLHVGTEGNSLTGFYSYVYASFDLETVTSLPLEIKELIITDDKGINKFISNNISFWYGRNTYHTEKIITSQGLETYPAIGWKVEAIFSWNSKEYHISSTKQ